MTPIASAAPTSPGSGSTNSGLRTAALLFDAELADGTLCEADLRSPAVGAAVRMRRVPTRPARIAQQILFKLGLLHWTRSIERPLLAAREAVLGARAAASPRFLVRVDEFPHYRAWDEKDAFGTAAFRRFHEIMVATGVPYLVAALPHVSREPLDPAASGSRSLDAMEVAMLLEMQQDGVSFALHGRDHRTRFASPRRRSELCGLDPSATEALLDGGLVELAANGVRPEVFVAPYNRFDDSQMPALARRFPIVCGGPESVGLLGFHMTPQWRSDTVYMPSYPPFYGTAEGMIAAAESVVQRGVGLWIPIVLHWEWEAREDWRGLRRLLAVIASHTVPWQDFLDAVKRSSRY